MLDKGVGEKERMMLNRMTIGDRVEVRGLANFYYADDNERILEVKQIEPKIGWYVGYKVCFLGRYVAGYTGSYMERLSLYDTSEPAHLSVTGSVKLARVRFIERGKEYLVRVEDIKRGEVLLPNEYDG